MIKILLTESTGFLGGVILKKLHRSQVTTIGRGQNNDIKYDLANKELLTTKINCESIIHCAGLAHFYPNNEESAKEFYRVNYEGTIHLFKNVELSKLKSVVFISTIAVYGVEEGTKIQEDYPAEPNSPYGSSKFLTESYLRDLSREHGFDLCILRLPLIVGDNPPGNLGKMIDAMRRYRYASVNKGRAKRSVVFAEDVADLIARGNLGSGTYNLSDGCDVTFNLLEKRIKEKYGIIFYPKLSLRFATFLAWIGDKFTFLPINSRIVRLMSMDFTVSSKKANQELNWRPKSVSKYYLL